MSQTNIHKRMARSGKIALITALLLVFIIGVLACALDIGWITMTKAQMQAACDASALAGGTELLPGLGAMATKTPTEVQAAVEVQAVDYAAKNEAGDQASVFVDPSRDLQLGTATFDTTSESWTFSWGATPYNAVGVTVRRDVDQSTNGDQPLPLFFAPVIGHKSSDLDVFAAAVIMPASGIRIFPGSNLTSELSPFAFDVERWKKYFRAQAYFETELGKDPSLINESIMDDGPGGDGTELFYEWVEVGNSGTFRLRQIFNDVYGVIDPASHERSNITNSADGILEINIYPYNSTEGNFGTVDIGGLDNSTEVIKRQILNGPSEEDMAEYANNTLAPTASSPITLQGDTGISGGIENTLDSIVGQCREILLYSSVANPGNTAEYTIVDIVGIRVMYVELGTRNKLLVIQPCTISDPAAVADYDSEIGPDTTFFTPLILAK